MKNFFARLYKQLLGLKDERGQDLIEYLLLVSLVAFAATAGMKIIATDINLAFGNIGTTVDTYVNSGGGGGNNGGGNNGGGNNGGGNNGGGNNGGGNNGGGNNGGGNNGGGNNGFF